MKSLIINYNCSNNNNNNNKIVGISKTTIKYIDGVHYTRYSIRCT